VRGDRERKWWLCCVKRKERKKRGGVSFIESWIIESCRIELHTCHIAIKGLGLVGQASMLSFKRICNLMETGETTISSMREPQIPSQTN